MKDEGEEVYFETDASIITNSQEDLFLYSLSMRASISQNSKFLRSK